MRNGSWASGRSLPLAHRIDSTRVLLSASDRSRAICRQVVVALLLRPGRGDASVAVVVHCDPGLDPGRLSPWRSKMRSPWFYPYCRAYLIPYFPTQTRRLAPRQDSATPFPGGDELGSQAAICYRPIRPPSRHLLGLDEPRADVCVLAGGGPVHTAESTYDETQGISLRTESSRPDCLVSTSQMRNRSWKSRCESAEARQSRLTELHRGSR